MLAADTGPVITGVDEEILKKNRQQIAAERERRRAETHAQIKANHRYARGMLFFPKKFTSSMEQSEAAFSVYSKEERRNVIRNGVQIHPFMTNSEMAAAKALIRFNCRVKLIQKAIDTDNAISLVRVIFDSKLEREEIVDFEPLVKEAIQYCISNGRRPLLSPVLSQFSIVFQPVPEPNDYNQKIQQLADFMECDTSCFNKIFPLFDYLNLLYLTEDSIRESWPLNQALLDGVRNTQGIIQREVMHFLISIIKPVSALDCDSALQGFVDRCVEAIQNLLFLSSDKTVVASCSQLMSFFNSVSALSAPSSGGVSDSDVLSNDSTVMSPLVMGGPA